MLLETLSHDFRSINAGTDATNTSWASKVPVAGPPEPNSPRIISNHPGSGAVQQNGIVVVPYGVGSNATTFSIRVLGWKRVRGTATAGAQLTEIWVPLNLIEVLCTLNTSITGVANSIVPATEYFCDTITVTTGSTLGGEAAAENVVSPANGTIAHFLVDMKGCQIIELTFNTNSSATSGNALWAFI